MDPDPQSNGDVQTHSQEPSPLWTVAFGGAVLALGGWFVIYETLGIFAVGSADWIDCLRGAESTLQACGEQLNLAYAYRYGIDALQALGIGLVLALAGPIPLIVMLRRFRNNTATLLMFFLVLFPYGLIAFVLLILAALIIIFYGIELV